MINFLIYDGWHVIETPTLPFNQTYIASNIKTKEEVHILGEGMIHVLHQNNVLYVSKELYEKIFNTHEL